MNRSDITKSFSDKLQALISSLKPLPAPLQASSPVVPIGGRFELMIEADDPRIAVFAACGAANLLNNYLAGNPVEDDAQLLLDMAELLQQFPELVRVIHHLAAAAGESVENIAVALKQLSDFRLYE